MDMMSNPGFVKDPKKSEEVFSAMAGYMKKSFLLSIVTDYAQNARLYTGSSILPALPHAVIDTSQMNEIDDYLKDYKNIKRKMRVLKNKGGEIAIQENTLGNEDIVAVKKCFLSTADKSVFYLPYQDIYLNAAVTVSKFSLEKVLYFIVKLNGDIIGYQAAIWTGKHLNALHGAFDRSRSSNYHAYDILFVKMAEFAIEHKLNSVDFGAVVNETKKRMVNKTVEMSYFLMSKFGVIQWVFNIFLKFTNIQGKEQLKFR
jgi:predicted N-acyltransferase